MTDLIFAEKMLCRFARERQVRYLSHLDYSRAIQRSLRRSGLNIAFSKGFNPRPKISFISAVSTGVVFQNEPLVLVFDAPVHPRRVQEKLMSVMPPHIYIRDVQTFREKRIPEIWKVEYIVKTQNFFEEKKIDEFNRSEQALVVNKKEKTINLKASVRHIRLHGKNRIDFTVENRKNQASPSAFDVLTCLTGAPVRTTAEADIIRKDIHLFSSEKHKT